MDDYKIIGIDLAKKNFHFAAFNQQHEVAVKSPISRDNFFAKLDSLFTPHSTFAFEACGGSHYIAQQLTKLGHKVIMLKTKDVKPYAKTRQKNDLNDAIAICKAALDPELMHVRYKNQYEQEITYLHKTRRNTIQQRIKKSNSIMSSLLEFGYVVDCGKTKFANECKAHVKKALANGFITKMVHKQMITDCKDIQQLLNREKELDKEIKAENKKSSAATLLETIPGIGPINASILSVKSVDAYESAKDFAASLGLVPKQNTTGGNIALYGITKQGDRYARTMLIQAGRSVVMRCSKPNPPEGDLYDLVRRLKKKKKHFNVICVAVANKLARIVYSCLMKQVGYEQKVNGN